jgi:L-erythrulose 1-phosphate isomerase
MRRTFVGTGWKMNFLLAEAEAYVAALAPSLRAPLPQGLQVFVIPPFTVLRQVCQLARGLPLRVGAQNMHFEERGAFTGEISPAMVKDCGADLVELGHSERRAMFGETDTAVNRKVLAALAHGLTPLVCVGETAEEKRLGAARETVVRQAKMALAGVPRERVADVLLAYEPVWAIGAGGTPAEPSYANAIHAALRGAFADLGGARAGDEGCVLYGGSVDLANARPLLEQPEVDGLFVGRTAWKPENLSALARTAGEVLARKAHT